MPRAKPAAPADKGAALPKKFTVEMWPTEKVMPYGKNPRRNEAAIPKVAAAIKKFGWRQPIVVDKDGVIIVGHTRLQAARSLGYTEVPVHVAHDMSAKDIRAYRLADNRLHEDSEWDTALLAFELNELRLEEDVDLLDTGFSEQELEGLIGVSLENENSSFPSVDETNVKTEHRCPKCGYQWSGDSADVQDAGSDENDSDEAE